MDNTPNKTVSWSSDGKLSVRRWSSGHPQVIGFVLGVAASLVAAMIFYALVELRSREFSSYVNPTRTTLVRSGQSSDLHVLYKGQDVYTDVTALQIAIWNAGKESVRSEHVLSPVVLQTSPKVPILEARLKHISRPVCGIALDESQLAGGTVAVSWKILEHNDGATIQLIVAGASATTVRIGGTIEGQPTIILASNPSPNIRVQAILTVLYSLTVVAFLISMKMNWSRKFCFRLMMIAGVTYMAYMLYEFVLTAIGARVPLPFD
jgi:hypothetical protein